MTYELTHPETSELYRLKIMQDTDSGDPREDADFESKMVCFHNRYVLPNEGDYRKDNFDSWDELENQLIADGAKVILPIYMNDHSGLSVKTTPFECKWDSGQIGFIFYKKETILENWGWKKISKKRVALLEDYLRAEIETYDQHLRGDVWGFTFEGQIAGILADTEENEEPDFDEHWAEIDSCWGFYGSDLEKNGILDNQPLWVREQILTK